MSMQPVVHPDTPELPKNYENALFRYETELHGETLRIEIIPSSIKPYTVKRTIVTLPDELFINKPRITREYNRVPIGFQQTSSMKLRLNVDAVEREVAEMLLARRFGLQAPNELRFQGSDNAIRVSDTIMRLEPFYGWRSPQPSALRMLGTAENNGVPYAMVELKDLRGVAERGEFYIEPFSTDAQTAWIDVVEIASAGLGAVYGNVWRLEWNGMVLFEGMQKRVPSVRISEKRSDATVFVRQAEVEIMPIERTVMEMTSLTDAYYTDHAQNSAIQRENENAYHTLGDMISAMSEACSRVYAILLRTDIDRSRAEKRFRIDSDAMLKAMQGITKEDIEIPGWYGTQYNNVWDYLSDLTEVFAVKGFADYRKQGNESSIIMGFAPIFERTTTEIEALTMGFAQTIESREIEIGGNSIRSVVVDVGTRDVFRGGNQGSTREGDFGVKCKPIIKKKTDAGYQNIEDVVYSTMRGMQPVSIKSEAQGHFANSLIDFYLRTIGRMNQNVLRMTTIADDITMIRKVGDVVHIEHDERSIVQDTQGVLIRVQIDLTESRVTAEVLTVKTTVQITVKRQF